MRLDRVSSGWLSRSLAALAVLFLFTVLPARAGEEGEEVDVALILAVDISYSMDLEEQRLQREGYIEALNSQEVLRAIGMGMTGKIAIAYFEWANAFDQRLVLPWTIIDSPASARRATDIIAATPTRRAQRTSISGALNYAKTLFDESPYQALRKVVDVSGDGPNNAGEAVEAARNKLLATGVVINGLPIVLPRSTGGWGYIENLDAYYADCVIGGPGSFMIPITALEQFRSATKQKIIREVAELGTSDVQYVQARGRKSDCMIGERMVRERDRWGN